jgi:hypothetical protein
MNEQVQRRLAALNIAWRRCASVASNQPDQTTIHALRHEYVKAWEGLDACGIAEWMLVYDPETLTFSLPSHLWQDTDAFATVPMPSVSKQRARSREQSDGPDTEPLPRI